MIEFEIDGQKLAAEPGKMIIEVADQAGIYIPRFCYHKKLSIAANCRMCLVEVEKSGKPLPACATPITQGMRVMTSSEKALSAQRAVMEFLLINHPLDCPICDQGGECELQDLSMGYGNGLSRYNQGKRSVKDKNLGPLISSYMTRCIQCTRCVRFGDEIAGMRELGAYQRGEHLEIGTYVQQMLRSEMSGNVIDVCPVGALVSKPYRFSARSWEMVQHPAVAPHDCVGSNIYIHTRGEIFTPQQNVMRVVPRSNESINEAWISDRDRFSYTALQSEQRLTKPLYKKQGQWQAIEWTEALDIAEKKLKKIIKQDGAEQIAALISPSATTEECYVLQKLMRGLGSHNIDHRAQQLDFSEQARAPLYPYLGIDIEDLEKVDTVILIGSFVRQEQPILAHRIRKATLQGAKVLCINPIDYTFNFPVTEKIITGIEQLPLQVAKIAKALAGDAKDLPESVQDLLLNIEINAADKQFVKHLKKGEKIAILLGAQALHHPDAALVQNLAHVMAHYCDASVGYLSEGANSAGAWLAGAVPHRLPGGKAISKAGLNGKTMFEQMLKAYILLGVEPEFDCGNAPLALEALKNAEFVLALSSFVTPTMQSYADLILPIAAFSENAGTFVNVQGTWQTFAATGPCLAESRPAWKILSVLGTQMDLDNMQYEHEQAIRDELTPLIESAHLAPAALHFARKIPQRSGLFRIAERPMYRIDSLVRRAKPLQDTLLPELAMIRIHPELARQLNLRDGQMVTAVQQGQSVTLPLQCDARIAETNVWIAAAMLETAGFSSNIDVIALRSAEHV